MGDVEHWPREEIEEEAGDELEGHVMHWSVWLLDRGSSRESAVGLVTRMQWCTASRGQQRQGTGLQGSRKSSGSPRRGRTDEAVVLAVTREQERDGDEAAGIAGAGWGREKKTHRRYRVKCD